jgi:hypothetical protein
MSSNSFIVTLQGRAAAFCNAQQVEVSDDLALFLAWVEKNPPVEVVTPKGEPRSAQSQTGQVWAYLDTLVSGGSAFTRKAACDALIGSGLNAATVSTQYQRWAKARGYKQVAPIVALPPVIHHKA